MTTHSEALTMLCTRLNKHWEPRFEETEHSYAIWDGAERVGRVYLGATRVGVELTLLHVEANMRGRKYGRAILATLCDAADACGVTLRLTARPLGRKSLTPDELVCFYESCGFTRTPGDTERGSGVPMCRIPHSPTADLSLS